MLWQGHHNTKVRYNVTLPSGFRLAISKFKQKQLSTLPFSYRASLPRGSHHIRLPICPKDCDADEFERHIEACQMLSKREATLFLLVKNFNIWAGIFYDATAVSQEQKTRGHESFGLMQNCPEKSVTNMAIQQRWWSWWIFNESISV